MKTKTIYTITEVVAWLMVFVSVVFLIWAIRACTYAQGNDTPNIRVHHEPLADEYEQQILKKQTIKIGETP